MQVNVSIERLAYEKGIYSFAYCNLNLPLALATMHLAYFGLLYVPRADLSPYFSLA